MALFQRNARLQRMGLGDTPGSIGAQNAAIEAGEKAGAATGSKYAQNALDAMSHDDYAQATINGTVPDYITDPVEQAAFTTLLSSINANGFASLSPEQQVQFNALRTTGTSDLDNPQVGGAESGDYGLDGQGDAPPNADVIAKVLAAHNASDYVPPAAAGSTERPVTIKNGVFVYVDDGTTVPSSELTRLGLKVTTSTPPVVATTAPANQALFNQVQEIAQTDPFIDNGLVPPSGPNVNLIPTTPPLVSSSMFSPEVLGIAGVVATGLVFWLSKRKKRR